MELEEGEFDHINIYQEYFQVDMTVESTVIQKKFRKLSLTCHPDLFPNDEAKAELFMKLRRACDMLTDPAKRKNYDAKQKARQMQQKRKAEATEETKKFRDKLDEKINEQKRQKKNEDDMKIRKSEEVVSAREEAMRRINEMQSTKQNKKPVIPKVSQTVPISKSKPIIIDDDYPNSNSNNNNSNNHNLPHIQPHHSKDSYASMVQSHNDFEAQILAQMLGK